MTKEESRFKIAIHAGKTSNFSEGYLYDLRYGFKDLSVIQQKFDEIFECLKELREVFYSPEIDKEILANLSEILYGSILYSNNKEIYSHVVKVFVEVLSETIVYLLEDAENPFEAFDNYRENYDDILSSNIKS